jgi:hypothetical protein
VIVEGQEMALQPRRTIMFRRSVIALATLSLFSLPAFAATEYWVAKSATTHKCEVVARKPDGKSLIEVGKIGHKTRHEAQRALKSAAECR